ncbi:hypothetical protein TI04_09720 [Achromatium sp. WMS2]|nr:hypothetical protein TI04_09720 [Achromatium sp. WMS2]
MNAFEAGNRGYKHKNLLFWLGMVSSLVTSIKREDRILDLGCGYGLFLPLLYEIYPFHRGVGIDFDIESINIARRNLADRGVNWPIEYFHSDEIQNQMLTESFDVIFGQEIIWWNNDLDQLAKKVFQLLKQNGKGYFTMGSHPEHPHWEKRRQQMLTNGIKSYTWSIDEVAEAFTKAGFSVGLRRLPIDGFFMYHPKATIESAGSLYSLVQTTTECKMLFYFGKHEPVRQTHTIR